MKGWKQKSIADVCRIVNGGTPKTGTSAYWGGSHQWITPAEMGKRSSPFVDATVRSLTDAGLQDCSATILPPNSVILSSRAPIGHLVINRVPMATNQGCKGLVPSPDLDPLYLYHYLSSIRDKLDKLGTGATFRELSGSKLKEVPIPLPPLDEQQRIVSILDKTFAAIARAKENAEKNLQNAKELFESKRNAILHKQGADWMTVTLDAISKNLDSKRVPITKSDRKPGPYPYYGASGIVDYVADYIFDGDVLLISEDGANLLARSTPIAFSISGKYWVNNHAHIVQFDDLATQYFTEHYFESLKLDEYITGAAQPKLNQQALYSIPISIPKTVEERQKVVNRLKSIQDLNNRMIEQYSRKITALDNLKKSLLHKAFAGEL